MDLHKAKAYQRQDYNRSGQALGKALARKPVKQDERGAAADCQGQRKQQGASTGYFFLLFTGRAHGGTEEHENPGACDSPQLCRSGRRHPYLYRSEIHGNCPGQPKQNQNAFEGVADFFRRMAGKHARKEKYRGCRKDAVYNHAYLQYRGIFNFVQTTSAAYFRLSRGMKILAMPR